MEELGKDRPARHTVADLERALGMPAGNLQRTLAVYNEHAARGEDPVLFINGGPGADAAAVVHTFIAGCRLLGVPARFVSGFVCPVDAADQVAPHAWAEAWVVDRWRSFDIIHDSIVGEGHLKIAVGADHNDACPIRGVRTGGGTETMSAVAQLVQ